MNNIATLITASGLALVTTFAGQASADQVTLTTPDGSIEMTGDLIGFNGVNYTMRSSVGVVEISVASVVCEGTECPALEQSDLGFTIASLRPEAELIKISE